MGVSSISIGSIVSLRIGISLGISRPLANVVSSGDDSALGHGVKSLGDGVLTGAGAEGDTVAVGSIGVGSISIGGIVGLGISISRPLANVVSSGDDSALGHGVKSLGDGVQTGAGAEGDTVVVGSVGIGVSSIGISSKMVGSIVGLGIGIGLNSSNKTSQKYSSQHDDISTGQAGIPM